MTKPVSPKPTWTKPELVKLGTIEDVAGGQNPVAQSRATSNPTPGGPLPDPGPSLALGRTVRQ